jgi:polyhydroxyalkanoate synthesis regulator phasin
MAAVDDTRCRPTEGNLMMNTNHSTDSRKTGGRRGLAVGLAGGLLAGTAAGLVFGVPGLTSAATDAVPAVLVQQTDETDTTTEDAPAEMGTRLRESLQELVDGGTITAEQADAVTTHLVENRPERGDGEGRGGHRGGPGMFGRGVASEALTDLLGIDAQELRTQLRAGATLAEIAAEQGVEVQAVVDELVAEVTERVDNAVENGRIDQAEADEKLVEAEAKITDMVNNGRPERGTADAED